MKTVLLTDTETTGTDDSAVCIEVAVALYSVEQAAVIRSYSSLIQHDANPAERVNRIPVGLLLSAPLPQAVWAGVAKFAEKADAIVAYGAEFDRRFVPASATDGKPWICAMDLQWPCASSSKALVSVALAHDVAIASAHRAATDVDILARLLTRIAAHGVDLAAFLARGLRPTARYITSDSSYDEARNAMFKAAGFRWDQREAPRQWSRMMAIEDAAALPFAVKEIG